MVYPTNWGRQTYSVKGWIVNILGCEVHRVSSAAFQFYQFSVKVVSGETEVSKAVFQ